jgi:hypothetical protein
MVKGGLVSRFRGNDNVFFSFSVTLYFISLPMEVHSAGRART